MIINFLIIIQVDFMNNRATKRVNYRFIKYLVLFALYFFMQYKFLNEVWFETDELDIMLGGKAISNGLFLYKDFLSQHMPVSYYISAIFDFFGATTVTMQRIAFYLFFSLLWIFIIVRYKQIYNEKVLMIYPFIFSSLTLCYDMGTQILSEHIAGIGFIILYLEFVWFYNNKELHLDNCLAISVSIFLTFGTIFIAVFAVFFIVIGVIMLEVAWSREKSQSLLFFLKYFVNKYILLVICVLVPWVCLSIYYLANGVFDDFIRGAYIINREIYPKYLEYGSDIFQTILGVPEQFMGTFRGLIAVGTLDYISVVWFVVFFLLITFFFVSYKENGGMIAVIEALFVFALGTRGCYNFHGTHWVAVSSLLITYVIVEVLIGKKEVFFEKNVFYQTVCGIIIIALVSPYLSDVSAVVEREVVEEKSVICEEIAAITSQNEAIWQLSLTNSYGMKSDRAGVRNVGSTPWFWEMWGEETLERFDECPPRIAIYNESNVCWNHALVDYAPELVKYMNKYYTHYKGEIYIRKDYYEEAMGKLGKKYAYCTDGQVLGVYPPFEEGVQYEQNIGVLGDESIYGIEIMVGTYNRANDCCLRIELIEKGTNISIATKEITAIDFVDNDYNRIEFDEIVTVSGAKEYLVRISCNNVNDNLNNGISLYYTDDATTDARYLLINNQIQDNNLALKILAK